MKQKPNVPQRPHPNPLVERIRHAYLQTSMTEAQFEALVVGALSEAAQAGEPAMRTYDQGFSDGYDAAIKEVSASPASLIE